MVTGFRYLSGMEGSAGGRVWILLGPPEEKMGKGEKKNQKGTEGSEVWFVMLWF